MSRSRDAHRYQGGAAAIERQLNRFRLRCGSVDRFSTVRGADRIGLVSDRRLTEFGTHQELTRAGGTYARLFDIQAAGYR